MRYNADIDPPRRTSFKDLYATTRPELFSGVKTCAAVKGES